MRKYVWADIMQEVGVTSGRNEWAQRVGITSGFEVELVSIQTEAKALAEDRARQL